MNRHSNYATTYQDSPHYARILSFDADAVDVGLLRNGELTAKKVNVDIETYNLQDGLSSLEGLALPLEPPSNRAFGHERRHSRHHYSVADNARGVEG